MILNSMPVFSPVRSKRIYTIKYCQYGELETTHGTYEYFDALAKDKRPTVKKGLSVLKFTTMISMQLA